MDINKIIDLIIESNNIVFFGGAGVSTESGIPDFRSKDGVYKTESIEGKSPEYIFSLEFLNNDPEGFMRYHQAEGPSHHAKPNITHKVLAKLEDMGKVKAVVTQNIDGLHQKAGSKNVYEIHGNTRNFYCIDCKKEFTRDDFPDEGIKYCQCGGYIRPRVVLYGESLPQNQVNGALVAISNADVLIIGGTSLMVYPAAGMINYYRGNKSILINKDKLDPRSNINYVIQGSLGKFFDLVDQRLKN